MKKISEAGEKLTWVHEQADVKEFVLKSGTDEFARLRWEKDGGSLATGETADGAWSFKRIGFFHPYVNIRDRATGNDIGRTQIGIGGAGSVQFADGEHYNWLSNLWRSEWDWATPSGRTLVEFRRDFSIDERAGEVKIPADHLSTIHLPLLSVLGWYLIVLLSEDAALTHGMAGR